MRFAPRRARKKDQSEKLIREALEKAGCLVYDVLPCDLLVRVPKWRQHPDGSFESQWIALECKTPTKTGKRRKRKDQQAQDAFLAATNTPVVLTPEDALKAVGAI